MHFTKLIPLRQPLYLAIFNYSTQYWFSLTIFCSWPHDGLCSTQSLNHIDTQDLYNEVQFWKRLPSTAAHWGYFFFFILHLFRMNHLVKLFFHGIQSQNFKTDLFLHGNCAIILLWDWYDQTCAFEIKNPAGIVLAALQSIDSGVVGSL